ncbi:hypothetical protein [Jiangella mangrovi]|uniref:DUF3800 domain-containing protein n=1 Tax=Jiangella mangrovi TaxID=1524084 RepID=A0A7W9LKS5_9ACTN|nr:hypothetical protein [Jiangella mangrovi]MBB5787421.1 hypothetical protein [Jiangella mangrovi]
MPLHAFADESIRTSANVYVLAALLIDEADMTSVRVEARLLGKGSQPRFHWRDQVPADRRKAAAFVLGLRLNHLVVVGAGIDPRRQERARRKCLHELLTQLENQGVEHAWLESRDPVSDGRDIAAVRAFRAAHLISEIRVEHEHAVNEPLLWVADLVAGAVGAAEAGEPQYKLIIADGVTEHRIEVD